MKLEFLTDKIKSAVEKLDFSKLTEIRLRTDFPIILKLNNDRYYLSNSGISTNKEKAIICEKSDIENIISKVTEKSLYAFNEKIKQGYLTTNNGIRIGLAGECVFDNGKIITIKNVTSLNIRIPHVILDASKEVFEHLYYNNQLKNTLIISPPTYGKTTILKDIAIKLNKLNRYSILIIDERGEFCNIDGENVDKITYSDKLYAFNYAIRSMSPDVIITDELSSLDDWKCANNALTSGVKIIASCHAKTMSDVMRKDYFFNDIFDIYAVLNSEGKIGFVNKLYDKDFREL